jgi:hypothetical protein
MSAIQVRIDKKYYLTGRAYSTVQFFQSERHLDNYLRFMSKNEIETKITGHKILNNE